MFSSLSSISMQLYIVLANEIVINSESICSDVTNKQNCMMPSAHGKESLMGSFKVNLLNKEINNFAQL